LFISRIQAAVRSDAGRLPEASPATQEIEAKEKIKMTTIKIGIIGSGGIARAHAAAYKKLPFVEIAAVADIVPDRARQFVESEGLTGASAFDSHTDLLKEPLDAVS